MANKIIIGHNVYDMDESFLGMKFHAYCYKVSRFFVYVPYWFAVTFFSTFFLKSNRLVIWVLLIVSSVLGVVLSWNVFMDFAPW